MVDVIRVDYETLTAIAARCGREAALAGQTLQAIQRTSGRLQNGGWSGEGAEAFFAEMNQEVIPAVNRLVEALAQTQNAIGQINSLMQAAEQEAALAFKDEAAAGSTLASPGSPAADPAAAQTDAPAGTGSPLSMSGTGPDNAANQTGNDWGLPGDWLKGITNSLQDFLKENFQDGLAAPAKEALNEGQAQKSAGQAGGGSGQGGGDSGGGSGSGGSGGGTPEEQKSPAENQPSSAGMAGGAMPQVGLNEPYGRSGGFPPNYFAGSSTITTGEAETSRLGRLSYQPVGAPAAGGNKAAQPDSFSSIPVTPAGGGPLNPAGQSHLGLPFSIAAASPFVALLGKAIKKKLEDR